MPYVEYDEVEAICSDCGRIFRSEDALAFHRDDSHGGAEESPRASGAPGGAVCPICRAPFRSDEMLRNHRASHKTRD